MIEACMHGTKLGSRCELCGGRVVGGSGPLRICKNQIWCERGWPFRLFLIVDVIEENSIIALKEEGSTDGIVFQADCLDDEFWFWGEREIQTGSDS